MNALQLPFFVEALLLLAAAAAGAWTRHSGPRFRIAKVVFHIFLFAWFSMGYGFIVYGLTLAAVSGLVWAMIVVMGLALVTQLVSGIALLARKVSVQGLISTHVISASVLFLADAAAFFLVG